ncbi:hypothetical protein H0I23_10895 [Cellulophaga sp. HaHaR_3_176]|uniref:hypothetical protein n=1 Tax=Cellulophaga sp. HaHaR_3_176 TaxID=1942464 RepID=UPI001C1FB42C|nr:hypothetical protein [Cellulophaga sp. HaHaR_3_176]QWX82968.1 hypothetical protein H0I23_10895 [Cellulophaga sp. HaHaR_3_176]
MKYINYKIENTCIEVYNSIFGKETIIVGGEKVSSKYSVFGTVHNIEIENEDYKVISGVDLSAMNGYSFTFYKSGKVQVLSNLISKKEKSILVKRKIIFLIVAVSIGLKAGIYLSEITH